MDTLSTLVVPLWPEGDSVSCTVLARVDLPVFGHWSVWRMSPQEVLLDVGIGVRLRGDERLASLELGICVQLVG